MSIQSLSIVVPGKGCINNCKFCVSRMHSNITYENRIDEGSKYTKALRYARDLGCTTLMLTGECEPQQNMEFLGRLFNHLMPKNLFNNIEIQTTGRGITEERIRTLVDLGVNTFSISVSAFEDDKNNKIIGATYPTEINLKRLCDMIKDYGCLLRLSINLNDTFYHLREDGIFQVAKQVYNADQVTLRKLYKSGTDCPQDTWIGQHCDNERDEDYFNFIRINGTPLEVLPYGNIKYSLAGVGTVADADCMAKNNLSDIRYLILRPDCHLYTRWDDPASIIF